MIRTALQTVTPEPVPAEVAPRDEHIAPAPRVSVQAFCETVETAAAIQSAGEDRRLGKAHVKIQMGGITAAIEAYRGSPTPNVIMLEADGHGDSILTGLDALAEFCDAGTRVVVVGRTNDVVLYRELVRRGVSDYMISPVGTIDVVRSICGLFSAPDAKPVGRVIAVVGAKGGVGASTISHNIAWAVAKDAPDAAVDFVKYLLSDEVQKGFAERDMGLPTNPAAGGSIKDPALSGLLKVRDEAPYVQLYFDTAFGQSVGGAMNDEIALMFAGKASPQDIVDATQQAADAEK